MGRRHRAARGASAPPPPAPAPSPPADGEELDIDAFSCSLAPFGLAIRDVSNDGNCFFRAVSDQLYGTEDYHMKLRARACDYLQAHKDHYQFFVDDEQSFDDYVADMRADGVWADNLELQAISMVYDVNIRVHQSGKPSYDIRNHPAAKADAIHISYHFGEHYASVRPLATINLNVPAQHHPLPVPGTSSSSSSGHGSRSGSQDGTSRRPRHGTSAQEDTVAAIWKRADRGHCDLCSLVDKTRRAARAIRVAEPSTDAMDARRGIAKSIEQDMREALVRLEELREAITDGKILHRMRTKKMSHRGGRSYRSESSSDSDAASSDSEESEEEQYAKNVRRKTDSIFASLNDTENAVLAAVQQVKALTGEALGSAAAGTASKNLRGNKKKEQEARRRERKERRRKEQERLARGGVEDLPQPHLSRIHELDIAI